MGLCCCTNSEANPGAEAPLLYEKDHNEGHASIDLYKKSNSIYKCIQSTTCTSPGTQNGKRKTNQDRCIFMNEFGPHSHYQLYGVCDGHGPSGDDVAQYFASKYPVILSELLSNLSSTATTKVITSTLLTSFERLQNKLSEDQKTEQIQFDIEYSGTTVNIGLIANGQIYLANVGDSRCVLGQFVANRAVPQAKALSKDHDPCNKKEKERVANCSNSKYIKIAGDGRDARIEIIIPDKLHRRGNKYTVRKINVSLTRSIGDQIAHKYGGMLSEPEITVHNITDHDLFVIFASDGIWNVMDNDDVMRVIGCKLNTNKDVQIYNDLDKITQRLVREANLSWIDEFDDYVDDITCVVCRFGI